jgi:hypothetical protein
MNHIQYRSLFIALALGVGLSAGLMGLLGAGDPIHAAPTVGIQVCASGCAFASIQEAVDAATVGELIQVASGVYTGVHARHGVTQVLYVSKTVTIRGGYGDDFRAWDPEAYPTTLDAQGRGRVVYVSGVGISPVIEGLRIVNGDAAGQGGDPWGNDAGGGIYANVAPPIISATVIYNNAAYRGGGLFSNSGGTLRGNTFLSNTASSGGGLYLVYNAALLDANVILSNTATLVGGGLMVNQNDATLRNTVIAGNYATNRGAGLFVYDASPRLLHTTFARNQGAEALYATDSGGTFYSAPTLTNTIVSDHSVGVRALGNSTATLHATLWHANPITAADNVTHTGDHTGDPAFAADGYHLTAGSAAIGRGVPAGVGEDLDGDPRPAAGPDLGADQAPQRFYLPLVIRNG